MCGGPLPRIIFQTGDVNNSLIDMWLYSFLLLKVALSQAAIPIPISPCDNVFKYSDYSETEDRWYGELTIVSSTNVDQISLRIALDRAAHLLVSWDAPITTQDNKVYFLNDPFRSVFAGNLIKLKILVKFDPSPPIPFVSTIHFNGRRICPPDSPLTLQNSNGYSWTTTTESQRPDIAFPENNDLDRAKSPRLPHNNDSWPCGIVDNVTPLVTHGTGTLRGQWPWHVALYKTEGVNLNYKCGATLVSKNKVLTAAHCVTIASTGSIRTPINPNQLVLYFGKHRLHQFVGEEGMQTKQVSKIVVNPGYNTGNHYGDLAVLTLASNADYTAYVRPVCLWEATADTSDIEGQEGSVVGWGLDENDQTSEELKLAKLPVVSPITCSRSNPGFYSQYMTNNTFCAGFLNGTTSPCNGDSGGGFVLNRNGVWYLRGLVSLSVQRDGLYYCDPRYYTLFTDVAKYTDFIQRNLIN